MQIVRQLFLVACIASLVVDLTTPAFADGKPEWSSDAAFKPTSLSKLAVIVSAPGGQRTPRVDPAQSNQQRLVEDVFVQALLEQGHTVAARSDLKSVLKEHALQQSGLTDGDAVEIGKLLTVPAVLIVSITNQQIDSARGGGKARGTVITGLVKLSARLVSVETGTIWWQGIHETKEELTTKSHLQLTLMKTADKLARVFPTKSTTIEERFKPAEIQKLAVVMDNGNKRTPFQAPKGPDQLQEIEDGFGLQLGKKGYTLVARADLQSLMKEKEFQASGLTEENVHSFGKLLNVPMVMVVRITSNNESPLQRNGQGFIIGAIGARLISVETGEVLWCCTYIEALQTKSKLDQSEVMKSATKKICDRFPSR